MRGNLADLVFEHGHPRLDTALRGVVTEVGHARGNEQVVELGVAELLQPVQQKLAARLGDDRVFDATTAADATVSARRGTLHRFRDTWPGRTPASSPSWRGSSSRPIR